MSRRSSSHRSTGPRSVSALAVASLLAALVPASPSRAAVQVVTKAAVSYPHFSSIQDAVNAAASGDWVLIDVGIYPGAVYITTPNLHIRGTSPSVPAQASRRLGLGGLPTIDFTARKSSTVLPA